MESVLRPGASAFCPKKKSNVNNSLSILPIAFYSKL